jgi:tripartite-type tricarboxylate transporter receptor subunit TctC
MKGGNTMKWASKTLMLAAAVWVFQGSMPGTPGSAQAQTKPYYEGKTILVIVGSGPGAGNDIRTRLFARHAARHLPGKPQLVVQNRSGGGGLRARNYLYNIAKPNGLTIAEIIRGTGLQHAINEPAARFKADKFNWIGNLTTATAICTGRIDRVGANLEEAIKRSRKTQLREGETSANSTGAAIGKMLKRFTGINTRQVVGYQGGAPIDLAMEKGEVDMRCGFVWSSAKTRKRHWFARLGSKTPFTSVLVQVATKRHPELSDIPTLIELAPDKASKDVAEMLTLTYRNAYPMLAPPGTPKHVVKILRDAFWATVKDPQYLADAKKIGYLDDEPLKGEDVQELIGKIVSAPEKSRKLMAKIIAEQ